MNNWDTFWAAFVSLLASGLGILIRYAHIAQHDKVDWSKLRYEVPTMIGMAVVAVPVSEYVTVQFGVHQGVVAAVCVCLGYLGPSALMLLGGFLRSKPDDEPKHP